MLALPIEAVVKEMGKQYVTKIELDPKGKQKQVKTEVHVGARNDRELEIVDGIAEGQQVLIKPASASENEYKM